MEGGAYASEGGEGAQRRRLVFPRPNGIRGWDPGGEMLYSPGHSAMQHAGDAKKAERRERHPDRMILEGGVSDRRRSDRW